MDSRTLEQIEGIIWEDSVHDSSLVTTCQALKKKPLEQFTVEDFRIMIGQRISLQQLIPRAINILEHNPLAESDYYPGDLLVSVIDAELARLARQFQAVHGR